MSTKYCGYMGEVLDIDLSAGRIGRYEIDDRDRERFLGGKSLAAKILWDTLKPGADPLSEDNVLVFMTGPLTGSGAPCSARFDCSTKNVMTGGIASSNCGGDFGYWLKKAGFDGLVVRGCADRPVMIEILENEIKIRDARHLWGLDTEQTQKLLDKRVGKLAIGPAGENLVRYASVLSGERALGRCGVGAVMGSKKLKAITAAGSLRVPIHDPAGYTKVLLEWIKILKQHPLTGDSLPRLGTAANVNACNVTGTLPTRNFQFGSYADADKISGETLAEEILTRNSGCTSCPIRCARMIKVGDKEVKGPEFETVGLLGSNIANHSIRQIGDWNYLLDKLGLDTISCAGTIACAMELAERGLLPQGPRFGEVDHLDKLMEDIAYRRGLGNDLAEGSMRLALEYGAPELAMHSKGLELASYEPRRAVGHGLGYAVSNRGACHLNGGYMVYFEAIGSVTVDPLTPKGKPGSTVFQQNAMEAISACGNCLFTSYAVIPGGAAKLFPPQTFMAKVFSVATLGAGPLLNLQGRLPPSALPFNLPLIPHSAAIEKLTGMRIGLGGFLGIGERGYTLERLFNLREGLTEKDDSLPPRLLHEPSGGDPRAKVPLAEMLPVYYQARDWDARGVPTARLMSKLSMNEFIATVEKLRNNRPEFVAPRKSMFENEGSALNKIRAELVEMGRAIESDREKIAEENLRVRRLEWAGRVLGSRFVVNPIRCRSCGECFRVCPTKAVGWTKTQAAEIDQAKCVQCGSCYVACPPNFLAVTLNTDAALKKAKARLAYRVDEVECKKCGICARRCPVQAIAWTKGELAFIHQDLCVRCGQCNEVCPPKWRAIEVRKNGKPRPRPPKLASAGAKGAGKVETKSKTR